MENTIYFLDMFPDYEPPEVLRGTLSQAAIVAADIDPATRRIAMDIYSDDYISARNLDAVQRDILALYDLRSLELTSKHPAHQLQKIEP